jgi:phosphate transport system protein
MGQVFKREIEHVKQHLLKIAELVENQVRLGTQSLVTRDLELATKVIEGDAEIDRQEVLLEEECLKLLALHQPVANDLRFIIAALKINNDLERIGDLSESISICAKQLTQHRNLEVPSEIQELTKRVKLMLKKCLLSFLEEDVEIAREALFSDREIDELNRNFRNYVISEIKKTPENTEELLLFLASAKALERIGDQASNIAEDIIYLLTGEIIRHGKW